MSGAGPQHVPVLVEEVLAALLPAPGRVLLDGTLGLGGHALAWLDAVAEQGGEGRVVGIDRDTRALSEAERRIEERHPGRTHYHHGSYEEAPAAVQGAGLDAVDAALLDLGVSSLQLDDAGRGFSFQRAGPLDMRMDADDDGRTAADLVNQATEKELTRIVSELGEEPAAPRIAAAIVRERRRAPFRDTLRLAETVAGATGGRRGRLHPATRTFQGLRMELNDELGRIRRGLPAVAGTVRPGGRMGVISFHRLEARVAKAFFRDGCREGRFDDAGTASPGRQEQRRNPRSRSALLRSVEILAPEGSAA